MRGAWIEIQNEVKGVVHVLPSPPMRGAWIEMKAVNMDKWERVAVAPHAGGVD